MSNLVDEEQKKKGAMIFLIFLKGGNLQKNLGNPGLNVLAEGGTKVNGFPWSVCFLFSLSLFYIYFSVFFKLALLKRFGKWLRIYKIFVHFRK